MLLPRKKNSLYKMTIPPITEKEYVVGCLFQIGYNSLICYYEGLEGLGLNDMEQYTVM